MAINEDKLNELIGQFVTDFGAAMHAATVVIGDKLGLYKALAEHGPVTGAELARRTGLDTRLVEEWLNAQFVSGYSNYDPTSGEFHLSEEQAAVLADDSTPAFLAGAMTIAAAIYICFAYADRVQKVLGRAGTDIAVRLSAFILFCIGVQILWAGASELLSTLPIRAGSVGTKPGGL